MHVHATQVKVDLEHAMGSEAPPPMGTYPRAFLRANSHTKRMFLDITKRTVDSVGLKGDPNSHSAMCTSA